jgi:hypothetical protein
MEPDGRRIRNPEFQEIVPHDLSRAPAPGVCALLTGSYLNHHFSAVYSLYRDAAEPTSVILEVDLADRCRDAVEALAVTYEIGDVGVAARRPRRCDDRLTWQLEAPDGEFLELRAFPPSAIVEAKASSTATVSVAASIDPGLYTHRLHYCWRWAKPASTTR